MEWGLYLRVEIKPPFFVIKINRKSKLWMEIGVIAMG
jgi:hypothetical protein